MSVSMEISSGTSSTMLGMQTKLVMWILESSWLLVAPESWGSSIVREPIVLIIKQNVSQPKLYHFLNTKSTIKKHPVNQFIIPTFGEPPSTNKNFEWTCHFYKKNGVFQSMLEPFNCCANFCFFLMKFKSSVCNLKIYASPKVPAEKKIPLYFWRGVRQIGYW